MLSEGEMKVMRNLASAVLRMGLVDASRGYEPNRLISFAEDEWCEDLCMMADIAVTAYRRELARRLEKWVDSSKLKRLRTYELVKVLKDGKDTGKHKNQEP
jgi:hypothetical protein